MSKIRKTKLNKGKYELKFCGRVFHAVRDWGWNLKPADGERLPKSDWVGKNFGTLTNLLIELDKWGDEEVMTRNCLNPDAGEFPIARRWKGIPHMDPACDSYHSF